MSIQVSIQKDPINYVYRYSDLPCKERQFAREVSVDRFLDDFGHTSAKQRMQRFNHENEADTQDGYGSDEEDDTGDSVI